MMHIHDVIYDGLQTGTQAGAQEVVERAIDDIIKTPGKKRARAKRVLLSNIGYWAGYYEQSTAKQIFELFETEHPYFGRDFPSMRQALEMGLKLGKIMATPPDRKRHNACMKVSDYAGLREWLKTKPVPQLGTAAFK